MENNEEFEKITLANVWIKEHILDIIKAINTNEIIAESGGLDLISLSEMENIEIIRLKIDALKLMKAYILQLKDNVSQYINSNQRLMATIQLMNIDDHENLLQNNPDGLTHQDNFYLSEDFQRKLNKLRSAKSILINACGDAELLMPKKDQDTKEKGSAWEDEEDE